MFETAQGNSSKKVSISSDGKPVIENISLSSIYRFSPAVSFVSGAGVEVAIDDLSVKINDAQEKGQKWNLLFNEDFERFIDRERTQLKDSGWIQPLAGIKGKTVEAVGETDNISIVQDTSNVGQSLRLQADEENKAVVIKSFLLPLNFPFDVSDKPFEIRYNNNMDTSISPISPVNERAEAYSNEIDYNAHGPYFPPVTTDSVTFSSFGQIQAVTVTYTDTYYIYSFDGKLLSEYDQTGSCVRDYIYAGNRLLAEYRPSTGKYYYYMSDQINSTRLITDDSGNVVYSEAYGPYGDVQKTWTKTYDPKQKFSGKEREGYSELDYFGARYFDNNSYRFISVDPVINKTEALSNPQLWNLYAYCRNNPITKFDPDGRQDADYLAQALAARHLDNNSDFSAQEYYQIVDVGSGFGAATGFAFITGYFAPEITVSLTSAISNYADKFQRGIDSWNRNKSTAEKIYKNLEGQLKNDGVKSIYKTLKGHQKALAEHLEKLKNGLEYESQVKSTISRINIAIKTTEKFIKDKGLK